MDSQPEGLEAALLAALDHVDTADGDRVAAELALTYARRIDGGGDLARLGPALLSCLGALGMTPAARAGITGGGNGGPANSPLDELRARRDAKRAG